MIEARRYMREYMREYRRSGAGKFQLVNPCEECGTNKRMRGHTCCEDCFGGEILNLTPESCQDCGIRPAPKYDQPGFYVPVIAAGLCDDCRLRRRRQNTRWGTSEWHAAHTPRMAVESAFVPTYEPKTRKATELTIFGSTGPEAY